MVNVVIGILFVIIILISIIVIFFYNKVMELRTETNVTGINLNKQLMIWNILNQNLIYLSTISMSLKEEKNKTITNISHKVKEVEIKIQSNQEQYNNYIIQYNNLITKFPNNCFAIILGLKKSSAMLEIGKNVNIINNVIGRRKFC